ncbi:MAG: outer membrane lipoprotein-sorting protein [Betaproteobacteria bacterium]|nr:outer membrane lipoprotein-sorting protein [Betaproteobacteria bacterium]
MFKRLLFAAISVLALPVCAADVKSLLKEADAFRLATESARVETEVRVMKAGKLDKTRLYAVYVKPGRRSLVVFRSPAERGQKMLMLGDDFWLVIPPSQRPLRITPMQKLLGDASTCDIASLTWAEDYDGRVDGEQLIGGVPCLKLDVTGQRKGVSYPRIVLYLAKSDRRPVHAELYVASDKLAKEADFRIADVDGRKLVSAMVLTDRLQRERVTEVHYLSRSARSLGDEYYNPAFLIRADIDQ